MPSCKTAKQPKKKKWQMSKCSELKSSVRSSAKVTMYAHGDYEHLFPLSFSPQTGVYVGLTVYEKYLTTVIFMKQKIHYGLVTKSEQSKMCIKLPTRKCEGDNLMQKFRGKHHLGI